MGRNKVYYLPKNKPTGKLNIRIARVYYNRAYKCMEHEGLRSWQSYLIGLIKEGIKIKEIELGIEPWAENDNEISSTNRRNAPAAKAENESL